MKVIVNLQLVNIGQIMFIEELDPNLNNQNT